MSTPLQVFLDQLASLLPPPSSAKKRSWTALQNAAAQTEPSDHEMAAALLALGQTFVVHSAMTLQPIKVPHHTTFIPLFEVRDGDGMTLMHRLVAIGPSASSTVALLASHRLCPLSARSNTGQTPLDLALATGNRVCAAILDRAVQLRKLTPSEREQQILNMKQKTRTAHSTHPTHSTHSTHPPPPPPPPHLHSLELVSAVQPLYEGLGRSF